MRGWRSSVMRRARSARADDLGGDPHARVSRRGAAVDRVGLAFRAPHARARTAERHRDAGQRRGRWRRSMEVGAAEGTVVEVNDLFYNLPARRKFLKSDAAESAQVSRIATQLALAYPGDRLHPDERRPHGAAVPAGGLIARSAVSALRRAPGSHRGRQGGGRPARHRVHRGARGPGTHPRAQNVFINRRIVKDRTIAHAIIDAYSVASIKERSPEVHLFIEMPPGAVDVNVHPTKAEVRFRDQSIVHEVVRRALMGGAGHAEAPQLQLRPESAASAPFAATIPGVLGGGAYPNRWTATPEPRRRAR